MYSTLKFLGTLSTPKVQKPINHKMKQFSAILVLKYLHAKWNDLQHTNNQFLSLKKVKQF